MPNLNVSKTLPIEKVLPDLLSAIEQGSQIILKAEPGAGKSTHLPLQLLKQKTLSGKIIMLEPRRLAAKNIAMYIANQLGQPIGQSVGYRIRGESRCGAQTQLEVVTEGILTQMIQSDPELAGVDLVVFDEFHERSLHSDTALAFALETQGAFREDLKLLVMSATLDKQQLLQILPNAQTFESEGRSFPVEVEYNPLKNGQFLDQKIENTILNELAKREQSMLVFLPGTGLIKRIAEQLNKLKERGVINTNVQITPLYGQLDYLAQQKAIQPPATGQIKVVLCTNIAETSLTIESISTVIDSGLERVAHFDLKSGVTRLKQTSIAQSSAVQRAGRAGRVMAGRCIRLYSEAQFNQQQKVPKADILTSDLSSLMLELSYWGESDPSNMAWIDLPPQAALDQAKALLQKLELIDDAGQLTEKGRRAREVGSSPRVSAMLIGVFNEQPQLMSSAMLVAALCEESHQLTTNLADSVYAWQTGKLAGSKKISQRAQSFSQRLNLKFDPKKVALNNLGLILSYGYPDRICSKRNNAEHRYLMANGHGVELKIDDPLTYCELIIAIDLMRSHGSSSQLFSGVELDKTTLIDHRKSLLTALDFVDWDEQKGSFVAEKQLRCGEIVLERTSHNHVPQELKIDALLNVVKKNGLSTLNWDSTCEQYQQRVLCAAQWCGELAWPDFSTHALVKNVEEWLAPYLNNVSSAKSLKKINIFQALNAYLAWPLNQELDKLLPTYWMVPTGSKKNIRYVAGQPPVLSVRMQEMFGEKTSPTVASGKVSVTLELLSPAQRPLQVTQDLASFWSGSYIDVKKEMRGRYPKHVWPDDPANHIATKKTKRHFNP